MTNIQKNANHRGSCIKNYSKMTTIFQTAIRYWALRFKKITFCCFIYDGYVSMEIPFSHTFGYGSAKLFCDEYHTEIIFNVSKLHTFRIYETSVAQPYVSSMSDNISCVIQITYFCMLLSGIWFASHQLTLTRKVGEKQTSSSWSASELVKIICWKKILSHYLIFCPHYV